MNNEASVIVLGGGPAGLASAFYLNKKNITYHLFEADKTTGGNCRTFNFKEFRYDSGAHRLHNVFPEITKDIRALDDLHMQEINAPSSIFSRGKKIDFPLTPLNLFKRLGFTESIKAILSMLKSKLSRNQSDNFRERSYRKYGKLIADRFLIGYSEKLWGAESESLSESISGSRLKGLDLKTFIIEILRGKNKKTRHIDGKFLYPDYGIGEIFSCLEKNLPSIHCNSKITRIKHDGKNLRTVEINHGEIYGGKYIISTLPISVFLNALDPPVPVEIREILTRIKFRKVILTGLILNKRQVSKDASIYFPDPEIPFTRLYEPKNRSPKMAPEGKTCIILETPMDQDNFKVDYFDQIKKNVEVLISTGLIKRSEIEETFYHVIPFAYPILTNEATSSLEIIQHYLSRFDNLILCGRSSEFKYLHIHDLFKTTKEEVEKINTAWQ